MRQAAVATVSSSRAAAEVQAPLGLSLVWSMADLTSFHPGGGDIILGSGVSATVYLHRHRVTGKPIAVKVFKLPDDIDMANRKVSL